MKFYNQKMTLGLATACIAGVMMTSAPARAGVVLSENFNSLTKTVNATNLGSNFIVSQGSVDVIGTSFFDFYPGNGNYLDLDGSSLALGTISSSTFAAGTYTLSFDLGAYTYNHAYLTENLKVTLGSFSTIITPSVDSSVTPGAKLKAYTFTFTTDTAGALLFSAINPNNPGAGTNVGPILDNVVLSAVPEASTWAMMIVGFFGLGFLGYRRRSGSTLRIA